MLGWVITFALIAIVAGVLGFGGLASASFGIAHLLLIAFIALVVIAALARALRGRNP